MAADADYRIATATVEVKAGTGNVVRTARIIVKHLTAMADELETLGSEDAALPADPFGQ